MTPLNSKNSLDESTGSIKVIHNNAMNANEQSTKTPWFLRLPEAILRKNSLIAGLVITGLATLPSMEAQKSGGGGIGGILGGVLANYIHDALTGNRVPVTPPMDGKITAKPKVESFNGTKRRETVQGENNSKIPQLNQGQNDGKTVAYDNTNDSWTEYYVIHWDKIVADPGYDPDDEYSYPFMVSDESLDNGEGFYDVGDEFKTARRMRAMHNSARKRPKTYSDGYTDWIWARAGEWVFSGDSERIKCQHRLKNEIKDTDTRLAKSQTYRAEVWWKLDYLTYSQEESDFKVARTDLTWRVKPVVLSATSPTSAIVKILTEKNTLVNILTEKGRSQLYWSSRTAHEPWVGYYTLWERKQHDELNSKSK